MVSNEEAEWIREKYLIGYNARELATISGIPYTRVRDEIVKSLSHRKNEIPVLDKEFSNNNERIKWILARKREHYKVENIIKALGMSNSEYKVCKTGDTSLLEPLPKLEKPKFKENSYNCSVDKFGKVCYKMSQEQLDWAMSKREEGYTLGEISKALNVNKGVITNHLRCVIPTRSAIEPMDKLTVENIYKILEYIKQGYSLYRISNETGIKYTELLREFKDDLNREKLVYDGN